MQESFLKLDEIASFSLSVYVERKFDIQEKEATLRGLFTQLMNSGGLTVPNAAM